MLSHTNESKQLIVHVVFHRKLLEEVHHQTEGINERQDSANGILSMREVKTNQSRVA